MVATLSILALTVMVALAMVSLASVSTKSSSAGIHMEIARANARLGLATAIAQLQENLGSDIVMAFDEKGQADNLEKRKSPLHKVTKVRLVVR